MRLLPKKLSTKHKNSKLWYYFKNFVRQSFPDRIFRLRLSVKLNSLSDYDIDYIKRRVNYYNKLDERVFLSDEVKKLVEFKNRKKHRTYFFDSYEYTRYFDLDYKIDFKFGDVTFVPKEPAIVKSRPIHANNKNSVVLNLDKVRHFTFVKDTKDFRAKKNMITGRNYGNQAHRVKFMEMYIDHPLCNIGSVDKEFVNTRFGKERMTFDEQLEYKFIICLEGNDVATNLKWVMSSNSLAVMPLPKYETWFMEGMLIPNYHYVLIKDDFSDLEERMNYYIEHPEEAIQIVKNANEYVRQFRNSKRREDLISLLVLEKYFYKTGQKEVSENLKKLFD